MTHRPALLIALALCISAITVPAQAQVRGSLTERDGTVRTKVGVRLSMTPLVNPVGDQVVPMSSRVRRQMAQVRSCYGRAVAKHPTLGGKVDLRLEAGKRGVAKVWVMQAAVEHKRLAKCFAKALRGASLVGIPAKAAAKVRIDFSNSGAAGASTMARRAREAVRVKLRKERDGTLSSKGATQGGEVQFSLRAKKRGQSAATALESLHKDVADRLAGLLDCRRRAGRRGMRNRGALVFDVQTGRGEVQRVRTVSSQLQDPKAPQCVKTWLAKAPANALKPGRVLLTLQFD